MARTRFWVCVHCDHDLRNMTFGQGHDTPLGHGQQLCEVLSRSNLAMRSNGLGTDFGYVCTVTLTSEIWPWVKVMTHPSVIDNKCVKYYPDPTWQWGVMAGHGFPVYEHCDLDLGVKVMTHPWVMDNNWKCNSDPTWQWGVMARTQISSICAVWPWPWRYDLGARSWHTLRSWTTIVWNYIQIGQGSTKLFLPTMFACWHTFLQLETHNQGDWSVKNQI